jgi:DNA-binding beta-propeller fold protein YncE
MMRISHNPPSFGPLLLGVLASVVAAFALSAAPALAATNNVYRAQFTRSETEGKPFSPTLLAFNTKGDVFVWDGEHGVLDEFKPSGSGKPLMEFNGHGTAAESFNTNGIAVNASGDLFVGDYGRKVVYEFEPDGKLLREINGGKTTAGSFSPTGVAVNSTTGDLYVADNEHSVVDEFEPAAFESSPTGPPLKEFSISEPGFIAVDASSEDLYVTSYAGVLKEFEPDGTLLAFNGSGTPQGSSLSPGAVAVAPSGEVYLADTANQLVDRFSSTGTYESQFEGGATPQGSFSYISGLAVNASEEVYVSDGEHHVVDLFSKPVPVPAVTTGPASEETTTSATLSGSIEPNGGLGATCEFSYGTTASYGSTAPCVPAGPFSSLTAVSAEVSGLTPGTEYHYRLEGTTSNGTTPGEGKTFTTTVPAPPMVSIKPVTVFADHAATFSGGVNPKEAETAYHFEYSTDGVTWTSLGQESAGEGTSEVPVTQTVSNLAGSTTYHVRLVAESFGGSETSGEETFTTLAAPPQIFGAGASDITGSEATLHATIYPEKQATVYRFEYGTTAFYGSIVPAGEGTVGASTPSQVSQTLKGLAPNTTYHFRVVATNATGSPTTTPDQTLTTLAAGENEPLPTGSCPNEALRNESNPDPQTGAPYSTQLPDCRAYEQVTPPFKSVGDVTSGKAMTLAGAGIEHGGISTSGSPVVVKSIALFGSAGADGELNATDYQIGRGASGWTTTSLTPPASVFPTAHEDLVTPADVAAGLWSAATPSQSIYAEDFYRRQADGAFLDIGPIAPPSATEGPPHGAEPGTRGLSSTRDVIIGASADLSDVMFQMARAIDQHGLLWPGDGTVQGERPSLYEYVGTGHSGEGGDVPALVGVDNNGTQISQCGTGLGANESHEAQEVRNGISAGGSTVFFNAQAGGCASGATGPAVNQLYARIGTPGAAQTTVNVAGTSGCATSVSCNVTSPVTYQGASKDGSKVFFTTSQALLPSDKDTTSDIYECELPGDGGATPAHSGALVNACPFLKAVSVTGTSSGANVQSVVAVSEEGSHVYFTATGVLTSTANSQGRSAEFGKDNLYVWEAPGAHDPAGHTAFIATLSKARPKEAQATPDGRYLVFTTTADVTLDDTSTVAQAFRYDAQTGELIRVSVGQGGFNSDGNTSSYPVSLASTELERLTVSEDGSYIVFQSNDALTPQVHGGLNNVYEWHDGNVYLISDGTDSQAASGFSATGLIGIDASGANVFFTTADRLVGQDTDEVRDIYDARIDGGFPAPTPAPSCSGEGCQGPLSSSLVPPLLGSTGAPAIGNAVPPVTKPVTPQPKPKLLTRAQKLTKALKQCKKDKKLQKRRSCEKEARKKYGTKAKKKK